MADLSFFVAGSLRIVFVGRNRTEIGFVKYTTEIGRIALENIGGTGMCREANLGCHGLRL